MNKQGQSNDTWSRDDETRGSQRQGSSDLQERGYTQGRGSSLGSYEERDSQQGGSYQNRSGWSEDRGYSQPSYQGGSMGSQGSSGYGNQGRGIEDHNYGLQGGFSQQGGFTQQGT